MYVLLVVLVAAAMSVALWLDNRVWPAPVSYWWVLLVAAYLSTALDISLRNLRYRDRLLLAGAGVFIISFVVLFGQLLTVYLSAAVLFAISVSGRHRELGQGVKFTKVSMLALGCLAIALLLLPMTINRIEVRLPNLSAGTTLTLLTTSDRRESLDAQFVNRKVDHFELNTFLGTEIVPGEDVLPPRLRIAIDQEFVVVRILSVRYQSHIVFFDVTIGEWQGSSLSQIISLNPDSPALLEMDRERLLISNLNVDTPLTLVLPKTDQFGFSGKIWLIAVLVRLLLLSLVWYAAMVWAPRSGRDNQQALV